MRRRMVASYSDASAISEGYASHSQVAYPWVNRRSLCWTKRIESGMKDADSSLMSSMTRSMSAVSGVQASHAPSDLNSTRGTGISLTRPIILGTMTSMKSRYKPWPSTFKLPMPICPADASESPRFCRALASLMLGPSLATPLTTPSSCFCSSAASAFHVGFSAISDWPSSYNEEAFLYAELEAT